MASAIIHIAVAKKVNELIKKDEKQLYLGTIAPDAAKLVGLDRKKTHFVKDNDNASPDIMHFDSLYLDKIKSDYDIGYYIHLLTDELWFNEFLPNYILDDMTLMNKDGNIMSLIGIDIVEILYNDYTNLNKDLIDYYNLDLSLFYKKFEYITPTIKEVPVECFDLLIDKMRVISTNTTDYSYILKLDKITHFIEYASIYVIDTLKSKKLI